MMTLPIAPSNNQKIARGRLSKGVRNLKRVKAGVQAMVQVRVNIRVQARIQARAQARVQVVLQARVQTSEGKGS